MRRTRKTRRTSTRGPRGFTLIELMTVLAIVAILTFGLATFSSPGAGSPRATADEITGIIQFARLRTQAQRVIHRVRFETTQVISIWESVLSDGVTPRVGFVTPTDWSLVQQLTLPPNVVLYGAKAGAIAGTGTTVALNENLTGGFEIMFRPDGTSSSGTIFLTDMTQTAEAERFRIFVYAVSGVAIAREGW